MGDTSDDRRSKTGVRQEGLDFLHLAREVHARDCHMPPAWPHRILRLARRVHTTPLDRALSKLGILSRSQATEAIRSGRVRVDGRIVTEPLRPVVPERVRIAVDEAPQARAAWRTLLFHKPRGVVTTRHDPEGRRTIYDGLWKRRCGSDPSDVGRALTLNGLDDTVVREE